MVCAHRTVICNLGLSRGSEITTHRTYYTAAVKLLLPTDTDRLIYRQPERTGTVYV